MLQSPFLQTEVHFLHLRIRDSFRRLHSRSFQQIMCLCHVNLNSKALAASQPVATRVIAFHQISCPFPAVFHQQQGSFFPPTFHLCFVWVTPELHQVLLALHTHTWTHTRMHLLPHELVLCVKLSCWILIAGENLADLFYAQTHGPYGGVWRRISAQSAHVCRTWQMNGCPFTSPLLGGPADSLLPVEMVNSVCLSVCLFKRGTLDLQMLLFVMLSA